MGAMTIFEQAPVLDFDQEKTAGLPLSEDPQEWAGEVIKELYRVLPELLEYTPEVMFLKNDPEQGYALGVVVVTSSTDTALSASRLDSKSPKALIPLVVKNHQLAPLDLLMSSTGRMAPLTKERLREMLFRPETFELLTEDWGDTTLYNMFYPPGRSDNETGSGMGMGFGGGGHGGQTTFGPGMKFAMLEEVLPSARYTDLRKIAEILESDPNILKSARDNDVFVSALRMIGAAEPEAKKFAEFVLSGNAREAAQGPMNVDVAQFGYNELTGEYWIKQACREGDFRLSEKTMNRAEFMKVAGPAITRKVDINGTVTLASGSDGGNPDFSSWETVTRSGIYKVRTLDGRELTGWVLAGLIDTDGNVSPLALFTNGAAAAVQESVAGAQVSTGVDLPAAAAKGTGVFYVAGTGGVQATLPVNVLSKEALPNGGDCYHVTVLTGETVCVNIVPGVQGVKGLGGNYLIPPDAKFLPLNEEANVSLVATAEGLNKTAAAMIEPSLVVGGYDGDSYSIRYHNMPTLAKVAGARVSDDNAAFVLCCAGLSAAAAYRVLADATTESVKVSSVRDLQPLTVDLSGLKASTEIHGLCQYLVKQAAVLPSVQTVDGVLSLGLLNPENVNIYVSRLPYLDKTVSMLGELLLASRLGLTEIPEGAAARALRGVDGVVQGLKALAFRDKSEAS